MRILLIIITSLCSVGMYAQAIVNGGFDNGSFGWTNCTCNSDGNCLELNPETVYGGSIPSNLVAEIDGHNNSSITSDDRVLCQEVACFIIGREYTLSFDAARRTSNITPDPVSIQVELDGGALSEPIVRSGPFNWINESFTFTATQENHLITFKPNFAGSFGMLVDNVELDVLIDLTLTPAGPFCEFDASTVLQASLGGGTWMGPGVDNSGAFDPNAAGIGNHLIEYTFGGSPTCPSEIVDINIEVLPAIQGQITTVPPLCLDDNPIILEATPIGGIWGGVVQDSLFDPSVYGPGLHQILYIPNDFCTISNQIEIEVYDVPNAAIQDPGVICQGSTNTILDANPAGGVWGGVADSNGEINVANLNVGFHTVTYDIINADGCEASASIEIEIVTTPNAFIIPPNRICSNWDLFQLNALPGGGSWGGAADQNGMIDPMNLGVGFHEVEYTVKNNNGCTNTATWEVEIVAAPIIDVTPFPSLCIDGPPYQLQALPIGVWSGAADPAGIVDPMTLGVGIHSVAYLVIDGFGCRSEVEFDIEVLPQPQITLDPSISICENDNPTTINVDPPGGIWSSELDASGTLNPSALGPGIYQASYTFTDSNGCSNQAELQIEIFEKPAIVIAPINELCSNGDPVQLTASPAGGNWGGVADGAGMVDPSQLSIGTHIVSYAVVSQDGCTETQNLNIEVIQISNVVIQGEDNYCLDNTIQQLIAMPFNGIWTGDVNANGSFNPTDLGIGDFSARYTFQTNNCETSETFLFSIVAPDPVIFDDAVFCQNSGSVSLMATPNNGTWVGNIVTPDGTIDTDQLMPGNFTVDYILSVDPTILANCETVYSHSVTIIEEVSAGQGPGTIEICNDGMTIDLFDQLSNASIGGNWVDLSMNPTTNFTNGLLDTEDLPPGSYLFSYEVDGVMPCVGDSEQIIIEIENPIEAGIKIQDLEFCEGDVQLVNLFDLIENYDLGGQWQALDPIAAQGLSFSEFSTLDIPIGDYSFQYTVSTGSFCDPDSVLINITINPNPNADAGFDQSLSCTIKELTIGGASSSGNEFIYEWTGNVSNPDLANTMVDEMGDYILTVRNTNTMCFSNDTVSITDIGVAPTALASVENISCFAAQDGFIIIDSLIGGTEPIQYSINGAPLVSDNIFSNLSSGQYVIEAIDANGCKDTVSIIIEEPDPLQVALNVIAGQSNQIFIGDSTQLQATVSGIIDSIAWTPQQAFETCFPPNPLTECFTPWVRPLKETTYQLTVFNQNGCSAESQITIRVEKDFNIYIPNVFTPNGDQVNDFFQIYSDNSIELISSFQIYNRWGELVFNQSNLKADDEMARWDGKFGGRNLNPGVFVYLAEIQFKDGSSQQFKGDVTIVK